MSSNLCQDDCAKCGRVVTLGDLRGLAIEFRQTGKYAPSLGCKFICPDCGTVYFAWVRTDYQFWSDPFDAFEDEKVLPDGRRFPNTEKGKFAYRMDNGHCFQLGYYQIDLAYYETGRDEGEGIDVPNPSKLFTADDDHRTRWDNHRKGRYDA